MAKRNRYGNKPRPAAASEPRGDVAPKPRARSVLPRKWLWAVRLGMAIVGPVLVLGAVEGGLRLFGYGYPSTFLVRLPGRAGYTPNEKFLLRFYAETETTRAHPFFLPEAKSSNTFRVFILGESAALGTPNPSFGFGRILEVLLRDQFPNQRIELFNAAMRGINSHIVLPIARECAQHKPDLVIVYMGNNEVAGLHGPGPSSSLVDRNLFLIRLTHFLKGTKLGQLGMASFRRTSPPAQDMAFFRAHRVPYDDPRRAPVYANFRANLEAILEVMSGAGSQVLLSTVPVNLKDFPPLASLPRTGLPQGKEAEWRSAYDRGVAAAKGGQPSQALGDFQQALAIDDHPAELHFRLAQTQSALEQFGPAKERFQAARDWDALQLRTDSRLNKVVRESAERNRGRKVALVDAEKVFAASELSDHEVPGQKLFSDHVHLRFAGDYLLARTFLSNVVATCPQLGRPAKSSVPSLQQCAEQLAYNEWEDLEVRAAIVQQLSGPPFLDRMDHQELIARAEAELKSRTAKFTGNGLQRAKASYQRALAQRPDDWQVHLNFGAFLMLNRDATNAVPHLEVPVQVFPNQAAFRIRLADALAWAGQREMAVYQLEEALRLEPGSKTAKEGLAVISRHSPK